MTGASRANIRIARRALHNEPSFDTRQPDVPPLKYTAAVRRWVKARGGETADG